MWAYNEAKYMENLPKWLDTPLVFLPEERSPPIITCWEVNPGLMWQRTPMQEPLMWQPGPPLAPIHGNCSSFAKHSGIPDEHPKHELKKMMRRTSTECLGNQLHTYPKHYNLPQSIQLTPHGNENLTTNSFIRDIWPRGNISSFMNPSYSCSKGKMNTSNTLPMIQVFNEEENVPIHPFQYEYSTMSDINMIGYTAMICKSFLSPYGHQGDMRPLRTSTEEKIQSVLQQHSVPFKEPDGGSGNTLTVMTKKQGVSGESCFQNKTHEKITVKKYDKDFKSKQLIKDAIKDNDFMKHLDSSQVQEIVDSMYPQEFAADAWVIREGEVGSHLYVSAMGEMEVVKDGDVLGKMSSGKAFGELAILYNCTRTASIRACTHVKVWVLDRRVFQQVMMRTGLKRLEDNVNFLSSMPLLKSLHGDHLSKIADALEVELYTPGSYIVRQGTSGDSFYIIRSGKVRVTQKVAGKVEEEEIRVLEKGSYFGEQALTKEDVRTANVIAMAPGVECLTLDRESFNQLIGNISEVREKKYDDGKRDLVRTVSGPGVIPDSEYSHVRLDELDILATLGVGGFGRVELVQYQHDKSTTFALKCLKKSHIVETQQQEHIYSEKRIMMSVRSPFIARLYKTFRDQKYVYMMMEACLGGEVWTILRDRGFFDDNTARFYTACVVEALEYLHNKNIIYRDLKPENLLLDSLGYLKLVDFGFSKKIGPSSKTWTFCGTPEYVAPEIILNKGHDKAVDYWSIGILMYELLTGTPPFTAGDPMKTYNIILKGIDMIDFPQHVPRNATSLIKRLCREAPSERLGYQRHGVMDIKKHKWFQTFDWESLRQRTLQPPIVPKIRGPTDAANFDSYPRDKDVPADEGSGWDLDF